MARRDSDDDIRKLFPDLKTILRHADPAHAERMLREAQDNPELDEALAERERNRARESSDDLGERTTLSGTAGAAPVVAPRRGSAPSPWAKDPAEYVLDKAALPSANAPRSEKPAVAPPVTSRIVTAEARPAPVNGRRTLPGWVLPIAAAIALSPFAMWAVASKLPPRTAPQSASSSVQVPAPVVSDSAAQPSIASSAPTPSGSATSAAAVPPTAPSAPEPAPSAAEVPTRRPLEPRPRTPGPDAHVDAGAPSPVGPAPDAGKPFVPEEF